MADELIPLAKAIAGLRRELEGAAAEGAGKALRFEIGPVEVTFSGVVKTEGSTGGEVGFSIFGNGAKVSAGGKIGNDRTQTIKLTLTPKADGKIFEVGAAGDGET